MNGLVRAGLLLLTIYAVVVAVAWGVQRRFVYFPDPTRVQPKALGLAEVEERWLHTADGTSVIAWYGRPRPGRPTLLYFHGNGGNLANRAAVVRRFMGEGFGVYMMSYRGYSGSGGAPSEAGNLADARLAYADLTGLGADPGEIVLYGESLGTGVATRLAVELPAAALVLEAPYTSIVDIGAGQFPFIPLRWLMTERYETIRIIGEVRPPLLVVHGEADRVVPVEMGRAVFAAALKAEPKRLVTLPGAGHNNHERFGSFEAIVEFLGRLPGRR